MRVFVRQTWVCYRWGSGGWEWVHLRNVCFFLFPAKSCVMRRIFYLHEVPKGASNERRESELRSNNNRIIGQTRNHLDPRIDRRSHQHASRRQIFLPFRSVRIWFPPSLILLGPSFQLHSHLNPSWETNADPETLARRQHLRSIFSVGPEKRVSDGFAAHDWKEGFERFCSLLIHLSKSEHDAISYPETLSDDAKTSDDEMRWVWEDWKTREKKMRCQKRSNICRDILLFINLRLSRCHVHRHSRLNRMSSHGWEMEMGESLQK